MQIFDFLAQEHIYICADIHSKNQLLEQLSFEMANISGLSQADLLNEFMTRETLCSTGLGSGIALPHIRVAELTAPLGVFFLLKSPIEFESSDKKAVDLIFALVTPAAETCQHLKIIAQIAELFSQSTFRDTIRNCTNNQTVFHLLQYSKTPIHYE